MPERVGGQGLPYSRWARQLGRLSYLADDLGYPFLLGYEQGIALEIAAAHREDLDRRYVSALVRGEALGSFCWSEGPDAFAFRTTATPTERGYLLRGVKGPVSGSVFADFFLVYARDPAKQDLVAIVVERSDPGVRVEPMDSMGLRSTGAGRVHFENVEVQRERVVVPVDALTDAQRFLNSRRIVIPCMVLGCLEAFFEAVVDDLRERVRYGVPLTEMQAVQAILGQMSAAIDACRASVGRMLEVLEQDEIRGYASEADAAWHPLVATTKYFVVEQSQHVIGLAQRVLGGRWYFDQWPFGRWMRDLQGFAPAAGTQGILEVDLGVMAGAAADHRAARRRRKP